MAKRGLPEKEAIRNIKMQKTNGEMLRIINGGRVSSKRAVKKLSTFKTSLKKENLYFFKEAFSVNPGVKRVKFQEYATYKKSKFSHEKSNLKETAVKKTSGIKPTK